MMKRVLVAHGDADHMIRLLEDLQSGDEEVEIVGPAYRAATALTLASTQPIDAAIVGQDLGGRRNGEQLADALARDWGIPSTLVGEPSAAVGTIDSDCD